MPERERCVLKVGGVERSWLAVAPILFFFCATPGYSLIEKPTEDSASVNNFALLDQEGKFHELYYYSDMKAVVLISQGNGCPIIRQEIPYLRRLQSKYGPKKVVFLMINANPQDDRPSLLEEAKDYRIHIPILEDRSQIVAESLNLTRTAEAILIDPSDWKIVYRGAITDRLDYGTQQKKAKHQYLRDAMDGLLEKKPVLVSKTPVKGCLIHLESQDRRTPYTYTKDVAPLLEKHCVLCHVPGGVAPWSMSDYGKIKGWGPMIREVLQTKRMPPWHADPHYGEFQDDISLNPEEVRTIVQWIDQGYPRGEGKDPLVKTRPPKSKWLLGQPDLIFSLKKEQRIPATGNGQLVNVVADGTVKEDIWVNAIDLLPSNIKVVHHAHVYVDSQKIHHSPGSKRRFPAALSMEANKNQIGTYGPGGNPWIFPEDAGIFIPKGSRLLLEMHYTPSGKPERDLPQVGLYLCKQKPSNVGYTKPVWERGLMIPAGKKNYKITKTHLVKEGTTLIAIKPHMHKRGKSMRCTATYPDGTSEILLSIPNYRFDWQRFYTLTKPKELPAGTTIMVEGTYDNSAQNRDNPDPSKNVVWGEFSDLSDMFICRLTLIAKKQNHTLQNS